MTPGHPLERAHPAAGVLPESTVSQEYVEDWTNSPEQADDRPEEFLGPIEIVAACKVDPGQDHSEGVHEERDHDLNQQLHSELLPNH